MYKCMHMCTHKPPLHRQNQQTNQQTKKNEASKHIATFLTTGLAPAP